MSLAQEYSDVEMTTANEGSASEDDDYVLVGQSEEVRRLKQQQRQLRSQLKTGMTADVPEKVKEFVAKGPEALKPQYTVSSGNSELKPSSFLIVLGSCGGYQPVAEPPRDV